MAAAPALQILALTSLFYVIFNVSSTLLLSIGEPKTYMYLYVFLSVFVLALNVSLVPALGITGAAYATLASYFMGAIISVVYLKKKMAFRLHWIDMMKGLAGGMIAFFIFTLIKDALAGSNPWARIAVSSVTGIAFYLVYLYASKTITKEEVKILGRIGMPIPRFVLRLLDRL